MKNGARRGSRARLTRAATTRASMVGVSVALVALSACSSSGSQAGSDAKTTETSTSADAPSTSTRKRPAGPASEISAELTAGEGVFMGEGTKPDLAALDYEEHEYIASGTASSYRAEGELTPDGQWDFVEDTTAPYTTRIVVRAPEDPSDFSGTVIVEWLNVSGGVDANPEWTSVSEEIVRAGDAWVGVSAQRIGVEGGPVLVEVEGVPGAEDQGKGLKVIDPARYGTLEHPGDGYAFDIYTQVAQALVEGEGLDGLVPERVVAAGESQSAFALVSYFNGVQPLTRVFDGFFVHSRGAGGLPLVTAGASADIAGAIGGTATIFRTDEDTPVLDIQTETDVVSVLNSYAARQPDSETFRLWEVAGAAHADAHLVGDGAQYIECGVPINDAPMHIVAKAAWKALTTWLTTGEAPVRAPRIDVAAGDAPEVRRDADGIALGGIRTPPVDVPVATLSGAAGPDPSTICLLLGQTEPFAAERVAELYPSSADYERKYQAATDDAIEAGFVLAADRAALLDFADPSSVQG